MMLINMKKIVETSNPKYIDIMNIEKILESSPVLKRIARVNNTKTIKVAVRILRLAAGCIIL